MQENQWYSFSLTAGRLEIQEEPMFEFESKGRKKPNVPAKGSQAGGNSPLRGERQPFRSIQPFVLFRSIDLDGVHPHWERQSALFSLPNVNVYLIQKHLHTHAQNNVCSNVWAPQSSKQKK